MARELQKLGIRMTMEKQVPLWHIRKIRLDCYTVLPLFFTKLVNIESFTASESEMEGIYRFTIAVTETEKLVAKVVKQIEKQVDVHKNTYYKKQQVVQQESALFKMTTNSLTNGVEVERIVREQEVPDFLPSKKNLW